MKKIILFLSFTLAGSMANAQTKIDMSSFSKQDEMKGLLSSRARNVTTFDNRYEGVKGTPYIDEDWQEGILTLSDSSVVKTRMKYKFDLIQNEVWAKTETGQDRILYNKDLLSLDLLQKTGQIIKLRKFKLPESEERHRFSISIFESANFILVKDITKTFRKANLVDRGITTTGNAYDWFDENNNFYIKKNGRNAIKVSLKKTDLVEAAGFPKSHVALVDKFCKDNGIKNKLTEEEAIKVLSYMDTVK
jgi:hypothetical protein